MTTPDELMPHYPPGEKESWGPGPWQHEPDRLEWRDAATGLPCMIIRNMTGNLCGYVGTPPGHRCHGKHYDDDATRELEVHGGLTYANACSEHICHVPAPGEPDDVWWLGFDCGHYMDIVPGMVAALRRVGMPNWRAGQPQIVYRDLEYVKGECADLARQLAAMQ